MQQNELNICNLTLQFVPSTGGHTNYMVDLLEHLNKYCRKQFLIAPKIIKDTTELDESFNFEVNRINYFEFKWLKNFKAKYCKWLPFPLELIVAFSFGIFVLKKLLILNKKYGIDVIIAHGIDSGVAATLARIILHKPVVWYIYGTLEAYSKASGKYESLVTKIFKPNHVFAGDSTKYLNKFIKLVGYNNVTAVPPAAVNIHRFFPKQKNTKLLKQLGLENKFIILSAHSLIPFKGIEYAILSFAKFLKISCSQNAILLILGEEIGKLGEKKGVSFKRQLENLTLNLGISKNVFFLGGIDHFKMPDYLSIADIVEATSIYSNRNSSVREAIACGKPVIAFDSGDMYNIIRHMETGLLAKLGDTDDFAEKMLILFNNLELRQIISKNARIFCEKYLSFESRGCVEFEVIKALLSK